MTLCVLVPSLVNDRWDTDGDFEFVTLSERVMLEERENDRLLTMVLVALLLYVSEKERLELPVVLYVSEDVGEDVFDDDVEW